MAQPPTYSLSFSFTDYTANYPTAQQPGVRLDTEFRAIKTTLDAVLVNLARIQRDDGALKNGIVGPDALSSEFSAGLRSVTDWTTGYAFVANDATWYGSALYLCATGHTSAASFATDLAASKWTLLTDIAPYAEAAAEVAVTAEVIAGLALDVDFGPVYTALAGKAALSGGNTFAGPQIFSSSATFSAGWASAAKATVSVNTATTQADYIELTPTDYGAGKPKLVLRKSSTADQFNLVLTDGAGGDTTLDIQVTDLLKNGSALLTAADVDNTAIYTAIRRAKHLALAL